jgi:hypothetical protein
MDILAFVQLNHTYENISCDFYHRAGDSRVPEFLRPEEGRANGLFVRYHDSFRVLDQEDLEHQEELERFGGNLAGCEEEVDREEGSIACRFSFRLGVSFTYSLAGATTQV